MLFRHLKAMPGLATRHFSKFLTLFTVILLSTATAQNSPQSITVRARGSGRPFLFLRDGRKVATNYIADSAAARDFMAGRAQPLALASADFDEDGTPDLAGGYAADGGAGAVTIHRGNIDALWAYRRAGEPPAFLPDAHVIGLPETPDFLAAGDFDADGHFDLVSARLGGSALYLLRGNGRGGFALPERVDLPGTVTAFTTGEFDRVDGLTDIAVAVIAASGPEVLVFESPAGALRGKPESFSIPHAVQALVMMPLDDDGFNDLAVGAGNELIAIHGRDRMLSYPKQVRDGVPAASVVRQTLPFAVRGLAAGRFTGSAANDLELAALGDDGRVHFLARPDAAYRAARAQLPVSLGSDGELPPPIHRGAFDRRPLPARPESRELAVRDEVELPTASPTARLVTARMSISGGDDLVVSDASAGGLHVLSRHPGSGSMRLAASLETAAGAPAAVLPMRVGRLALQGLVVLQHGQFEPTILPQVVQSIYTVTNTQDPGAGQLNTQNESVPGSLRWAISSAIDAGGTSLIEFNIPVTDPNYDPATGTFTITPLPNTNCSAAQGIPCQGLPPLPPGCVIDGYTQPGGTLNGIVQPPASPNTLADGDNAVLKIVISGTKALQGPDGIWLFNGSGTVRGLIVNGFNSALNPGGLTTTGGFGINADSGNNFVEGNFLGVDAGGTKAVPNYVGTGGFGGPNTIGGTTPQARNLLAGNTFANFGAAVDSAPNTYFVQGNYIGTDRSGTQALSITHGGLVEDGVAMVIGGTSAGAGNLVSGNNSGIDLSFPAGNPFTPDSNLLQGNLVGTDPTGTLANGNVTGVIVDTGNNNLVGGTTAAARNLISGNLADGMQVQLASQNTNVQGNYIGVDTTGSKGLANAGMGINDGTTGNLANAIGTLVGGESAGAGNVISGNASFGIQLGGSAGPLAATILGNLIGTDATGKNGVGNGAAGVSIFEGASSSAIGGTDTSAANVIAFNGGQGVSIDPANQLQVGQQVGGSNAVVGNAIFSNHLAGVAIPSGSGNRVSQNSIYSNTGLGIDLNAVGHQANNNCQLNTSGGNLLQNAPLLTAAVNGTVPVSATATDPNGNTSEFSNCADMAVSAGVLNIAGSLNSLKNTTYTVEFFQNAACDGSGFGQGKTFLNSISVTTDAACNATFGDNVNLAQTDVAVTLGPSTFVTPAEAFTYQADVVNKGPGTATGVTLHDTLPAGVTFVSATTTQGTCSGSGNPLTCSLGTLASGATAHVQINVTITGVNTISDTVTVSTTTTDPVSGNNTATLNLTSDYQPAILDHFNPVNGIAGTGPLALDIFGFGFYQSATTLTLNNTATAFTLLDNQQCGNQFQPVTCQALHVTVPATLTASAGTVTVAVSNPAPGGNSQGGPSTMDFVIYPNPGTVTQLQLSGIPNPAVENTSYNLTVKALDSAGHVVPAYRGIVNLQDDFGIATFSPVSPYQFTAADSGVHVFSTSFSAALSENLTVADAGTPAISTTLSLTINPLLGPAARLSAGLTPDNIPTGFPFPQPFSVTVLDASDNLLPGISVTFAAPPTGASGKFSNNTTSINAVTDANGVASAVLTANQTAGQFTVTATVGSLSPAQWFPTSTSNVPAHISIVDGNPQSGPVNTQYAGILDVLVTDAQNSPVLQVPVKFTAPTTGASVNLPSTTALTAKFSAGFVQAGEARLDPIGVANGTAGAYQVTASVGSLSVPFNFTNSGAQPAVASLGASGTPQVAAVGTQFSAPLAVTPRDANGNCLAQVTITFTVPNAGASATLSTTKPVSDAVTCVAQVTATANATAGSYTVTATAPGGASTTFSLTNTAGVITVTATGGTPQSTPILTRFTDLLQANLVDSGGKPISGATVNFSAPATGASATLSPASAVTDTSGNASVFATANGTVGSYAVTASFGSAKATFQLTNAPAPAILSIQKTHTGSFSAGQTNAAYSLTVSNSLSAGPSSGVVTVTDYLPPGLTLVSIAGTKWTCTAATVSCTRSDALAPGGSYDTILVTVSVAAGYPSLTNQAGVSGGGSAPANASDLTTITLGKCDLNKDTFVDGQDAQVMINESLGKVTAADNLSGDGIANVVDVQIVINAAKNLGCSAK